MNRRKIWFISSLAITFCAVYLLYTGSSLLNVALDKSDSIPLGTFITWAGLIAIPFSIYWGTQQLRNPKGRLNALLSRLLKFILVLAFLWVPISYLLSGNISFNFAENGSFQGSQLAMKCFWSLSYGIVIGAISILIIYWVSLLIIKMKPTTKS